MVGSSQVDGKPPPGSLRRGRAAAALRRVISLRPRFQLRDLLWLVLLSALGMTWYRDHQALQEQISARIENRGSSWSIKQILGAPDTPSPGDRSTAWASASQDSSPEWVVVEFPRMSDVAMVEVVETYNPGAVRRVCSVNAIGSEEELWKGIDPTPSSAAMGRSLFSVPKGTQARRIKVYLDSVAVAGWNEIDAVALHDRDGSLQWATDAWASSAFGSNRELPNWFWP